jgi:membrane protein implicated in regulation of membrane protease activity
MRLVAWFIGALLGGAVGALVADVVNASDTVQLVLVVVFGLGLAALGEALVKRRQASGPD